MAKRIIYRNHCTPQEQVNSGEKYYLDGDCGRKLTGFGIYTLSSGYTGSSIKTSSAASHSVMLQATRSFVFIKALSLAPGSSVLISFDIGSTYPVRLLEGECFASKVDTSVLVIFSICTGLDATVAGIGKVEYWAAL